jgi:hypothetical protein
MASPNLDREALDAHEQSFWGGIWKTAASDAVAEHGIELRQFGPVQVTLIADLPRAAWLNLVLGAGSAGAVEEGHLEAGIEWAESFGVDYYVPVTPALPGSVDAQGWLSRRGYDRGYGWMKFARDGSAPELPEPEGIEIVELAAGEGEAFASIVAAGFGLPPWASTLFLGLPQREGWHCYVAIVDGEAAAGAAMLAGGGIAEFGLAATLEAARGRGCQLGLLRRRILDAIDARCHTLFVETGERSPDRPASSYRNILRAGFEEAYLRPNWQRLSA